jgi:hypothetical protein
MWKMGGVLEEQWENYSGLSDVETEDWYDKAASVSALLLRKREYLYTDTKA